VRSTVYAHPYWPASTERAGCAASGVAENLRQV
jgi:hypothetical protein